MIEYGLLCIENQFEGLEAVRQLLGKEEFLEVAFETVPDENAVIRRSLRTWVTTRHVHLILTVGGCSVGLRERVPEVTAELLERPIPGIVELMRLAGIQKKRSAALWRSHAGQAGRSLIVNLPNDQTALALEAVLPVLIRAVDAIRAEPTTVAR